MKYLKRHLEEAGQDVLKVFPEIDDKEGDYNTSVSISLRTKIAAQIESEHELFESPTGAWILRGTTLGGRSKYSHGDNEYYLK